MDDTELPASLLARQSIQMEDGWEGRLGCGINESAGQIIEEAHPAILENLASIGKRMLRTETYPQTSKTNSGTREENWRGQIRICLVALRTLQ